MGARASTYCWGSDLQVLSGTKGQLGLVIGRNQTSIVWLVSLSKTWWKSNAQVVAEKILGQEGLAANI